MRRLLCLVWPLVLVLAGCAGSESAPATSGAYFEVGAPPQFRAEGIRVATLNAEFLFDGLADEGGATFPHKGDPAKARAHRDRIGAVVRMLDADVVMLAEVENERALQMLIDESLADLGYAPHFLEGADSFTGQDMALLARIPIDTLGRTDLRLQVEGEDRMQGVSKNVFARMTLGGVPTTMIGVHFYARPSDPQRKPRREAQAEVIRRLAAQELQDGRAVIILGDFNDYDETTPDRNASVPISDVLARLKAAGPGPADDLHNVLADVPQEQRFTAHWDRNRNGLVEPGELTAIDHILLSPQLYRRVREVVYVHAHDPTLATDHFPIVVTIAE